MRKGIRFSLLFPILVAASLAGAVSAEAQVGGRQITTKIDDGVRITLAGNTRPEARDKKNDSGAVPDSLGLQHMQLVLRRTPAQERMLDALIEQLTDRSS